MLFIQNTYWFCYSLSLQKFVPPSLLLDDQNASEKQHLFLMYWHGSSLHGNLDTRLRKYETRPRPRA